MFKKKIRFRKRSSVMTLEEKKEYEMHSLKVWVIKHFAMTVIASFVSIIGLFIYVVSTTKEMTYLEALMTGIASILSAITSVFGV